MIVDTHMHIYDDRFDNDREEVIQNAIKNNVTKMIVVGCDYETSLKAIELANSYDFIYSAIGIHPSEVNKLTNNDLGWIYELSKNKKVIAIGEIGLDYYWNNTYNDLQKEYFKKQLQIAVDLNLPVIIHSRDAILDTYNIIREFNQANNVVVGVMHCFQSSLEMAKEFTKLGFYIGVGGVLTFKNSREIKRVVQQIDLNYLLSETDSPYLTPHPFRGQRNEPAYIKYVVEEIAKTKQIDINIVMDTLYNNVCNLFKI